MILLMAAMLQDPYRVEEEKGVRTLHFQETPRAMAASPDGATLAVGAGPEIHLIDLETGKLRATIRPGKLTVRGLAFDGTSLAAAMLSGVGLFDAQSGKSLWIADGRADGVAVSGDVFTISSKDRKLRRRAAKDGTEGRGVELEFKEPCRIVAAKDRISVADAGGAIVVLGRDLKPAWTDGTGLFPGLAFSPDGTRLAIAGSQGGGRLHVKNAADGESILDHSPAGEGEIAVAWVDGKRLVTAATRSGGVNLWKSYDPENDDPPEPVVIDAMFGASDGADRAVVVGKGIAVAGTQNRIRIFRIPKD